MTEQDIVQLMQGLLTIAVHVEEVLSELEIDECVDSIDTFEGVGLLTDNKGLVVTMTNGNEFQIQIVRSK